MDQPPPDICRAILCSFACQADSMAPRPSESVVSPEMYRAVAMLIGFDGTRLDSEGMQRSISNGVLRYWGLPPMRVDPAAVCAMRLEWK